MRQENKHKPHQSLRLHNWMWTLIEIKILSKALQQTNGNISVVGAVFFFLKVHTFGLKALMELFSAAMWLQINRSRHDRRNMCPLFCEIILNSRINRDSCTPDSNVYITVTITFLLIRQWSVCMLESHIFQQRPKEANQQLLLSSRVYSASSCWWNAVAL